MNKKLSSKKNDVPPHEFFELVANLLVSCIQGLNKSLPAKDKLLKKLKDLENVVRKGVRISPANGLGKEIEEIFDRQIMEQKFLQEEKDIVKIMLLEVAETITSILSNSSGFETDIGTCVKQIENADNIKDILQLKDVFVEERQKVREHSHSLNEELVEHDLAQ